MDIDNVSIGKHKSVISLKLIIHCLYSQTIFASNLFMNNCLNVHGDNNHVINGSDVSLLVGIDYKQQNKISFVLLD